MTTEDLPHPANRVTVDRAGRIHVAKTYHNLEPHKRLLAKLKQLMGPLGCHEAAIPSWSILDQRIPLAGNAHQCGTVRFGTDPASSALDVNCRAHDVDNLYVVDTSFFPSSGAVNPALTAMANALRVGDHLLERLDAPAAAAAQIERQRQASGGRVMKTAEKVASSIGKGLVAGFAGTAAMTVSSTLEARLRGRAPSTAPGPRHRQGARHRLVRGRCRPGALQRPFPLGLRHRLGSRPRTARRRRPASRARRPPRTAPPIWGSAQVTLPALDVAPPVDLLAQGGDRDRRVSPHRVRGRDRNRVRAGELAQR